MVRGYKTDDGYQLGQWVGAQRKRISNTPSERRQRLNAIGFSWDAYDAVWENRFSELEQFKLQNGHCNVPTRLNGKTYPFGVWIGNQRKHKDTMSVERRQRLNAIGFSWDAYDAVWENRFSELEQFKLQNGHCNVPTRLNGKTYPFGGWIGNQRNHKDTMSVERRQRLNQIGFVWRIKSGKKALGRASE